MRKVFIKGKVSGPHGKEGVGIRDGGDHDVEQPNEENQLWSHPTERLPSSKFMSPLYP